MTQPASRSSNFPPPQPPTPFASSTLAPPVTSGGNLSNLPRATATTRLPTETPKTAPDTTSDKATAAFIRRTLCAHNVLLGNGEKGRNTPRPIDELLPPLTSSNDVDLQLYAIIAVIIKEFVYTWYSKITPDQVFVGEVIQVIAHCTRALEQRLRKVDLEALLLDEIPELLEAHVHAYRLAHRSQHRDPLVSRPRTIYHTLHPHPALSPVPLDADPASVAAQQQNEAAWRQLVVQGVLAVLLPTEDLENGCLRLLLAEIFADMILGGGISEKACEGWLLWEGITRIAEVLQAGPEQSDRSSKEMKAGQTLSRLEQYGLLSSSVEGGAEPAKGPSSAPQTRHGGWSSSVAQAFWATVQLAFWALSALRAVAVTLATCSSLPRRSAAGGVSAGAEHRRLLPHEGHGAGGTRKRAVVSMNVWRCIAQLAEVERRMPWLAGAVGLVHWAVVRGPGRVGDTDGGLDRLLSHAFHARVLNPSNLPPLLRTLRATLFPANALAPPRAPPSAAESLAIKRRCAATILSLVPDPVAAVFHATREKGERQRQVEELLDCLGDSYLNKHLVFGIVELIVVRLVPEVGERGVVELMEERVG